MDHLGDRHTHGESRTGLFLDHLGTTRLRPLEDVGPELRAEAGILFERQSGDAGTAPHGHHAVAVLAEDHRLHLCGWGLQVQGEQRPKAEGVEERAEAHHVAPGKVQFLLGQIREDVDGV